MCGIIGFAGKKNATDVLLKGLSRLEYRGYDSAGIAVQNGNTIKICRAQGKLQNLEKKCLHPVTGCAILYTERGGHPAGHSPTGSV